MKPLMKALFLLAFVICFCSAYSQTESLADVGLYKNENDFSRHKLSYAFNCNSKEATLKTNKFFESKELVVKNKDQKIVLLKKDFFGYHDCNGKDYRFYKNQLLEILDTADFYLYKHTALEPHAGGKGYSTVTRYYFSRAGDSDVRLLNVRNLGETFPANSRFRYALESYAHNDNGLMDYDVYAKVYKVKYLYLESLK